MLVKLTTHNDVVYDADAEFTYIDHEQRTVEGYWDCGIRNETIKFSFDNIKSIEVI